MPGATAYAPLPNFSIEQWRMVVIITENVRFVTSYSRLQTSVLAKFVDTTCILFYTHSPYSLYSVS